MSILMQTAPVTRQGLLNTPVGKDVKQAYDRGGLGGALSYLAGPHLTQGVRNLGQTLGLAGEFTDAADVRDYVDYAKPMSSALMNADWETAGRYALPAAAAMGSMMLPYVGGLGRQVAGAMNMPPAQTPTPTQMPNVLAREGEAPASVGHNQTPLTPYELPAGSDPRYLGAAPDRSDYTHLRYVPKKPSDRVVDALDAMRENRGGIKDKLIADIRAGEKLGGNDWYNTEELRDWFVTELGEETGHREWRDFIHLVGASSTGAKVPSNIGIASMYRSLGPEGAMELAARERARPGDAPKILQPGYGHKQQKNHALNTIRHHTGEWTPTPEPGVSAGEGSWNTNPKPKGFAGSLLGNMRNIAADLHFTRYMAMVSGRSDWLDTSAEISDELAQKLIAKHGRNLTHKRAKGMKSTYLKKNKDGHWNLNAKASVERGPVDMKEFAEYPAVMAGKPTNNEYAAFEAYINEVAEELGMTGPQVQANLWMGAAKRTGVADESQGTFMEIIRKRAATRAKIEENTPSEVLRNFIRNKGLLAIPGLAAGGTAAGLMQAPADEYGT